MTTNSDYPLVGKKAEQVHSIIQIADREIGGDTLTLIAGPCSVESKEQIFAIAEAVSQAGATLLRGGAFKPRTSPYSFQGLGEQGLRWLHEAAAHYQLPCISEAMSGDDMVLVAEYVDVIQIGSRNMQNFDLLRKAGQANKPILLKRGFAATYAEFLAAAEYIANAGNPNIILCERGIRTFETYTRNTLDIAAIPVLKSLSHLPVIADPSHGTGRRELVLPMSKAAVAAGADGLMIEVHTDPDASISDADQTISVEQFAELSGTCLIN